jgi:hypothetical protein
MDMIALEDLPISYRILIAIAAVLLTLLLILLLPDAAAAPRDDVPLPAKSKYEVRLIELETQAIEEAFKQHMIQLFKIWVTDNYQPIQPPRFVQGARNARDAFDRSMQQLEQREQRQ